MRRHKGSQHNDSLHPTNGRQRSWQRFRKVKRFAFIRRVIHKGTNLKGDGHVDSRGAARAFTVLAGGGTGGACVHAQHCVLTVRASRSQHVVSFKTQTVQCYVQCNELFAACDCACALFLKCAQLKIRGCFRTSRRLWI